ncbi:hypothetical protein [Azospirillum doebereinerae]
MRHLHPIESTGVDPAPAVAVAARTTPLDIDAIADRYGWTTAMARWWVSCAASTVGTKPEAVIAFLDRTVGGVTMIRRR